MSMEKELSPKLLTRADARFSARFPGGDGGRLLAAELTFMRDPTEDAICEERFAGVSAHGAINAYLSERNLVPERYVEGERRRDPRQIEELAPRFSDQLYSYLRITTLGSISVPI
jgi:hypothetical protein